MKKTVCFLVLLALAAGLLTACSTADRNTAATSVEQLREPGRIIGVATGTGDDVTVQEAFPDAKIQYFNDNFLGYSTVASGKIDAFVYTKLQMELAVRNGVGNVTVLDETKTCRSITGRLTKNHEQIQKEDQRCVKSDGASSARRISPVDRQFRECSSRSTAN